MSRGAVWSALPPPVRLGTKLAVGVDMLGLEASVRFDVANKVASVTAEVHLAVGPHDGLPIFDLRQQIDKARWDGLALPPEALAAQDIGAGPGATVRVIDAQCAAGGTHVLQLEYTLATPLAPGSLPLDWSADGISWDLWMSDLEPGRYLEMWFPANLCHDRVEMELSIEVAGTARPHVLLANGDVREREAGSAWTVRYPANYTSLSPLLVLAPADLTRTMTTVAACGGREIQVVGASMPGAVCELEDVLADSASWVTYFGARYGRWAHGDRFLTVMWGLPRGMEYDGATTACGPALEHEIFHSWFGRGVKPAAPRDGWMDEAMATWATASGRSTGSRYANEELGLDEPPTLLCPDHPWSRYTPREAYAGGRRLLAGVAHMSGGADRLRAALADWHRAYGGSSATTEDLAAHLGRWCERDLSAWWERYVYGQG